MAEVRDRHTLQAASIVGSMHDPGLQETLRRDTAQALADAEAQGYRSALIGGIRVLRVLEYVYPDAATMTEDMSRWGIQGDRQHGKTRIRSAVLPPEVLG